MPTTSDNQKIIEKSTKSGKKQQALKMLASNKYTKSDISRILGIDRGTIYNWIEETTKEIKGLDTSKKISLWQSESIKDSYLAGLARDMLVEQLSNSPNSITPSEKRSIAYAMSMSAGLKWDKSKAEAGQQLYPQGVQVNIQVVGQPACSGHQDIVVSTVEGHKPDNKVIPLINNDKTYE